MQKVYTKIESIVGNVVTVRADGVRNGDLALVGDSYANVIKLDRDLVTLQVFSGTQGVSTTDPVRFLGRPMMVSFSDHLLGRIFDGAGVPRDNGPALTENMIPIGGPSVNPSKRIVPNKLIRTGIPMIDVFNTLVESQKLPIFSVSGEPYNQLLSRIAMQAQVDIIVLGGMGLKYDDYLYFRDTLEKSGAMGRTVMFIHTASDPTVECTLVPDMALAVAEQFALAGKRVLVLLTDMTNYADAQKEMAITMEQVPSNRGYPGDLYSCLAARYEKAVDFERRGLHHHSGRHHHARRRRDPPRARQHRLYHRGAVLPEKRPHRALRLPVPSEAERQRQDQKRPPGPDGRHDPPVQRL